MHKRRDEIVAEYDGRRTMVVISELADRVAYLERQLARERTVNNNVFKQLRNAGLTCPGAVGLEEFADRKCNTDNCERCWRFATDNVWMYD